MVTTHRLPEETFTELARGDGDPAAVRLLRGVQHSKNLLLLLAIAQEAERANSSAPEVVAFRRGYRLLTAVQQTDPGTFAWFLTLPHVGGWAHDSLTRRDRGRPPDFGYLASVAAAAGIRSQVPFELDVPVSDGRVALPGLGYFHGVDVGQGSRVRLHSDGEYLAIGPHTGVPCAALVPDDGSAVPDGEVSCWHGIAEVRAVADGQTWRVLLDNTNRYLDRYMLPMAGELTADDVADWRRGIESAWRVLVRHHGWAAGPMAEMVSTIVPLITQGTLQSATASATFGAISTSWPPTPVAFAETLIHEFQHLKLSALMDMRTLTGPCDDRVYAPWRPDPRPAAGIVQGLYAHLGVTRFWDTQRQLETGPDEVLRAQVTYERWRLSIETTAATLLESGALTPAGVRLVEILRERGKHLDAASVPSAAREIASESALDHSLNWQLRHTAVAVAGVTELAAAYRRGETLGDRALPATRIEDDFRKVDSTARSQLLNLRYLEPERYRELCAAGMPGHRTADQLLMTGNASGAVQAYRAEIFDDPRPDAWIGLALAIHRLPSPSRQVFATQLPLLFEVHACLAGQGIRSDPLDLAAWFLT